MSVLASALWPIILRPVNLPEADLLRTLIVTANILAVK